MGIVMVDDPILNLGWSRQFFTDQETDWVRRQVRLFVPPSVNAVFVRCGLIGTGQVILDDASLTAEPAQPAPEPPLNTNLLADPGFEGDQAWEYGLPPFPNMRAVRDTTVFHSGKSSIRLTSPPGGQMKTRAGVSQVIGSRALAGKHVRFTGFIKCDSLQANVYVSLYCQALSGSVKNVSVEDIFGTQDWRQASVEIDVPADGYAVWAWFEYAAPVPGRVYFDDASLEVTGKAAAAKP
jgi:hypothetical protein